MLGIYDSFGYVVSDKERYKLIKEAGFDQVMLWWCDGFGRGPHYREGAGYARSAGLIIENIHTPVMEQNNLSLDNLDGEALLQCYLQCVKDCSDYEIPTMVVHLPDDTYPINTLGIKRLEEIVSKAEMNNVNIAFENLNNIHNLIHVLEHIVSDRAGFCYDSCHYANYENGEDLLGRYGNRLMAIHLHDNGGERNQHQLPFDGNINWAAVMKDIASTGYKGAISLEPMNWGYESLTMQEFLKRAYTKAKRLDELCDRQYNNQQ